MRYHEVFVTLALAPGSRGLTAPRCGLPRRRLLGRRVRLALALALTALHQPARRALLARLPTAILLLLLLLLAAVVVVVLVVSVPSPPGAAVDVPRRLSDTVRRQSEDRQVGSQ
jgi:hypothetical protein